MTAKLRAQEIGLQEPSRRRSRRPVTETKDKIRATALRLFAEYGYDAVSLQAIAAAADLHKSSVFHHYRFKSDLAADVFEVAIEEIVELLRPLEEDDPPSVEGGLAVVDAIADHLCAHSDVARLIMAYAAAPEKSELNTPLFSEDHPILEFYGILWNWLERAQAAGVLRRADLVQTIVNLMALVLFYPTAARSQWAIAGRPPFSPEAREHRKRELHRFLSAALVATTG